MIWGLLGRVSGLLEKWIPDGTRRAEVMGELAITALTGLGWAQKWLAVIFGTSLALQINAPWVGRLFGVFIPIEWWAVFLNLTLVWVMSGRDIKDLKAIWDKTKDEANVPPS